MDAVWKVSNTLVKNCTFLLELSLKAPYMQSPTHSYTKHLCDLIFCRQFLVFITGDWRWASSTLWSETGNIYKHHSMPRTPQLQSPQNNLHADIQKLGLSTWLNRVHRKMYYSETENNSCPQSLLKAKFSSSISWKVKIWLMGEHKPSRMCVILWMSEISLAIPPLHFLNHLSHWLGFLVMEAKQNSVVKILDIPINKFQIKVELS